jgi:hypothetical protein
LISAGDAGVPPPGIVEAVGPIDDSALLTVDPEFGRVEGA